MMLHYNVKGVTTVAKRDFGDGGWDVVFLKEWNVSSPLSLGRCCKANY